MSKKLKFYLPRDAHKFDADFVIDLLSVFIKSKISPTKKGYVLLISQEGFNKVKA